MQIRSVRVASFLLAFLIPGVYSTPSYAISELGYAEQLQQKVLPFYFSVGMSGSFISKGVKIACRTYERSDEQGALVILPGRDEPMQKYAEVIYDLRNSGYSLYILSHRGQGESGRMTSDSEIGHVDRFSDYIDDLAEFMDHVVLAKPHSRILFLAHSMGAAIATGYILKHPGVVDAAVYSSPMLRIPTRLTIGGKTVDLPEKAALELARAVTAPDFAPFSNTSISKRYAPGKAGFDPDETFQTNSVTTSEARWEMAQDLAIAHPELRVRGPSWGWVRETIAATRRMRRDAGAFTVPLLMLRAGNEQVVVPAGQKDFCAKAPSCQAELFSTAKHELLQETDRIRDQVLADTLKFFAEH
jgi:lysophospholipase